MRRISSSYSKNLIGNAIKYRSTERKALVHVSAQQQNGSLDLRGP
jgi:hypothetical protein